MPLGILTVTRLLQALLLCFVCLYFAQSSKTASAQANVTIFGKLAFCAITCLLLAHNQHVTTAFWQQPAPLFRCLPLRGPFALAPGNVSE